MPQYSAKVMDHFTNPRNVGEIPDADGIGQVGNPVCLAKRTKVQLNNHVMGIEDVDMYERILTHEGVYSHVIQRSEREYSGDMIRLSNSLGSVEMTPDHLLYAIKIPKGDRYMRTKNRMKLEPDWYHAEEIEKGDIALYPVLKEIRDLDRLPLNFEKKRYDHRSFDFPEDIAVDADLLRLFGYYMAEGNSVTKITEAHIFFTFNITEMAYVEDVARTIKDKFCLDAKITLRRNNHMVNVIVNSANLARLFKDWFGDGAANKHMPDFMLFLPPEKQKSIIEGLWKGDGCICAHGTGFRALYSTISVQLVNQVKMILLRLGIVPSVYHEKPRTLNGAHHTDAYRIHVGGRESLEILYNILGMELLDPRDTKVNAWIENGFLHTPIRSRRTVEYSGEVLNFEVEGQHSYTTDAFTVHNCGDLMWIYIKVKDDVLTEVKFKTFGCGAAIATSSMITELAKGKTIQEGLKITRADVAGNLGGLPPIKMHCSNLAADGLHEAIHDYLRKQGREPPLDPNAKKVEEEESCEQDESSPIVRIQQAPPK